MATERLRTTCNRDCPDACGLVATVADGRVVRLEGDRQHPITRGFLCARTARFLERQYSPDRILQPRLRENGRWRTLSFDAALDLCAERLAAIRAESGPAAILHYRSGGSLGLLGAVVDRFFEHLGPVTTKRGDICSGAGEAAQLEDFGQSDSHDLHDLPNARHVLVWGRNVAVSSPHTLRVLRDAAARGTRLLEIDPVRHRTSEQCERVVQPRPGGDLDLALAVARLLLERGLAPRVPVENLEAFRALALRLSVAERCARADVPVADARDLADRLADGPTAILVGWGLQRRPNGGATVRALDALSVLSGNLGVPGGGVSFQVKRRGPFELSLSSGAGARTLAESRLGAEILAADAPPVRAVFVTAANPVASLPDSQTTRNALETREFTVVVDTHPTDTTEAAHLVLPTTTLLEADDLIGSYGHHWLGVARPVVAPPPGVRSDLEIVQALAQRLGFGAALAGDARAWKRRLLGKVERAGVTLEALEEAPRRNPLAPTVLFADGRFPTPSGRARLLDAEPPPEPALPDGFPLRLLAVSHEWSQCTQEVGSPAGPLVATLHPGSAAGLPDGAEARLESRLGRLAVRLRHDATQRRDVVIVPKGGRLRDGRCANALLGARTTDLGEGACYYDEPVRLVEGS